MGRTARRTAMGSAANSRTVIINTTSCSRYARSTPTAVAVWHRTMIAVPFAVGASVLQTTASPAAIPSAATTATAEPTKGGTAVSLLPAAEEAKPKYTIKEVMKFQKDEKLVDKFKKGEISKERIEQSYRRIIAVKQKLQQADTSRTDVQGLPKKSGKKR